MTQPDPKPPRPTSGRPVDLALWKLSVTREQLAELPTIRHHLREVMARISRKSNMPASPIYYLQSSDYPEARAFLRQWRMLSAAEHKVVPIEAVCLAAAVSPLRIVELIVQVARVMSAQSSSLITSIRHPEVVDRTIDYALLASGESDRRALEKAVGFVPIPKSAQTNIQINTNASATAQAAALASAPRPENTIRRLVDRFNETRSLSAQTPAALPEHHDPIDVIPAREPVPITVPADLPDPD